MDLGIEKKKEVVTVRKCGYQVVMVALVDVAGGVQNGLVSSK